MSGNGGLLTSLQAATTGRPPPDRGRVTIANPMEDITEEDLYDEESPTGQDSRSMASDELWDDEEASEDEAVETSRGGLAAAVNELFPTGIANASDRRNHQAVTVVTGETMQGGGRSTAKASSASFSLSNPISSGRNTVFPMGVNQPRSSLNSTRPHVTPQATFAKRLSIAEQVMPTQKRLKSYRLAIGMGR